MHFPNISFDSNPDVDRFIRKWYSGILEVMDEFPLVSHEYRFLWLRTSHSPVMVRLDESSLLLKELDGKGGYNPGKLSKRMTKDLSHADWQSYLSLLDRTQFWHMPATDGRSGLDGSRWLLEGYRENYHAVSRWSPGDGDFRSVCLAMLDLTGKRFEPIY